MGACCAGCFDSIRTSLSTVYMCNAWGNQPVDVSDSARRREYPIFQAFEHRPERAVGKWRCKTEPRAHTSLLSYQIPSGQTRRSELVFKIGVN
jgi:hypothetical protein